MIEIDTNFVKGCRTHSCFYLESLSWRCCLSLLRKASIKASSSFCSSGGSYLCEGRMISCDEGTSCAGFCGVALKWLWINSRIMSWLLLRVYMSLFSFRKWVATSSYKSLNYSISLISLRTMLNYPLAFINLRRYYLRIFFPPFCLNFNNKKYPINLCAFSYSCPLSYSLSSIFAVLISQFSMERVFVTTTNMIETIRVPQIATKSMMTLPNGVWGK